MRIRDPVWRLGHRVSLSSAGLIFAFWLIGSGWRGYRSVRHLVAGLDYIALGMLSFALAWLTSLVKGGKLIPRTAGSKGKFGVLSD